MKKYIKPEIMFEDFTLSTNIAAGCEYQDGVLPSSGKQGCGLIFGSLTIFVDSAACSFSVGPDDGEHNTICYHIPAGDNNIFTS